MNNSNKEFYENIVSGFIENNQNPSGDFVPRLLTNNKKEGIKILSSIITELNSCNEFWFSVAFLTNSGLQSLINTFLDLKDKKIHGKILVSQYLNFTQPEALKRLLKFDNIELRINTKDNFHSKGYLFKKNDHCNLIIGSSNLTANALSTNKELNLKISAKNDSYIITKAIEEFQNDFNNSETVDLSFIEKYQLGYIGNLKLREEFITKELLLNPTQLKPNLMQIEALTNLKKLREIGKNKALLISATGTGKTYLSAFDAKDFNPQRLLFVVHRTNIAEAAMESFKRIFGSSKSMGLYTGNERDINKDFLFSTVQTISKAEHLSKFKPDEFDYIIIDESHRADAKSYRNIVSYLEPSFLLGMTATPERPDGNDIFSIYDHNIAYEIRLQKALELDLLSPFHYFGVTDLTINGNEIDTKSKFNLLTSEERVDRILEKSLLYNCDNGRVRGLVFCSKKEIAIELSNQFNKRGYKSIALTDKSTENQRSKAIDELACENDNERLDYIFTVDIFNEGIDIPKVNQIIMLRPTQSAIVFVQQLGRGLRKAEDKEYLTVIDFIGNYENNFLIPIALFGDTSYDKVNLRKLISGGSNHLAGSSTINFERIAKEKIFSSIDKSNFSDKKDLNIDYNLLKNKLGRIPKMMDFINYGYRDPIFYCASEGSYLNYISKIETELSNKIDQDQTEILKLFSNEVNNGKRVEESEILSIITSKNKIDIIEFKNLIKKKYNYFPTDNTINSAVANINFYFIKRRNTIPNLNDNDLVIISNHTICISKYFSDKLENDIFKEFLIDNIDYGIFKFNDKLNKLNFKDGFIINQKYSRKDVFRILNQPSNPNPLNVGGYSIVNNNRECPIFVTLQKGNEISESIKYEDKFINNKEFEWMSKSPRYINSNDVQTILGNNGNIRLPLFVQKNNKEGLEFYYLGDIKPIQNSEQQETMKDDNQKTLPVVKIIFKLETPVNDSLYNYLNEK
jgi:superfamily II DNA or RNA helicase/HKD family nuclease